MFSISFLFSYEFSFSAFPRTFLSNEPPETLDSLATVDFRVSVRISNLFFISGLFECFCGWGSPIRFCEGFWFSFS